MEKIDVCVTCIWKEFLSSFKAASIIIYMYVCIIIYMYVCIIIHNMFVWKYA